MKSQFAKLWGGLFYRKPNTKPYKMQFQHSHLHFGSGFGDAVAFVDTEVIHTSINQAPLPNTPTIHDIIFHTKVQVQ